MSFLPHALPDALSRRLGQSVARTRVAPNLLTLIGLAGTAAAAALVATGRFWQGALVMFAAAAFDLLDGAVARATGRTTRMGAILDAVADRLGEFALLFALLVWYSAPAHFDREAILLLGATISGSMLVSYTRSKAGEFNVRIRSGLGTRLERLVILGIGLLADQLLPVLWILAVLTNLTALQRLGLTWWTLRRADAASPADPPASPLTADQPPPVDRA